MKKEEAIILCFKSEKDNTVVPVSTTKAKKEAYNEKYGKSVVPKNICEQRLKML